jgi:hypothetical protein
MSLADRKRKNSKTPSRAASVLGSAKRQAGGRVPRAEAGFLDSDSVSKAPSPSNHLSSFHPNVSSNVVNIDQGAELEKLSSKLFGIPLLAGTNFGLRIHPGSDYHVPLVVKDTIDWLAHYGMSK